MQFAQVGSKKTARGQKNAALTPRGRESKACQVGTMQEGASTLRVSNHPRTYFRVVWLTSSCRIYVTIQTARETPVTLMSEIILFNPRETSTSACFDNERKY